MGLNKRLLEYAKSFCGVEASSGDAAYQALFDNRRNDFRMEIVVIDGKKYQIEFDQKKSPSVWGVERLSYVAAKGIAQKVGLSLLTSSEWGVLRDVLQHKDVNLERQFWSGFAELTDTLVDYDNGLVIEHPVFENGQLKKSWSGKVRAERVLKTEVPKGVEDYLCDIEGYDDFFDAVYGIKHARRMIGDNAYVWTADKGVKVVVRANAEVSDEENRLTLDATIDLSQECEEKDLFGVRLCHIRLLDEKLD